MSSVPLAMTEEEIVASFPQAVKTTVTPYAHGGAINHISLPVKDMKTSLIFYDQLLATLGYGRLMTKSCFAGYGTMTSWGFWIGKAHPGFFDEDLPLGKNRLPGMHVCLQAPSRKAVDDFYQFALKSGCTCDGPPGIRKQYMDVSIHFIHSFIYSFYLPTNNLIMLFSLSLIMHAISLISMVGS